MPLLHHAPTCHCCSDRCRLPHLLIVACPCSFCCCLPPPQPLLRPLPPLKWLQRRLSPSPSVLVAVGIERAALALALLVARPPHCRCHRPHRCHRRRSSTTLIAIAFAAIATTLFVAQHLCRDPVLAAIAIAVRRCYPHHRRKRFHCHHCQRCHRCLNFHQPLPLLLPLPPPPLPHMP